MSVRTWRILLLIWLVLIFLFSSTLFSSDNTEKVLVYDLLNYVVRKCAHIVEYAILTYLWFRALCVAREKFLQSLMLAIVLSILYAASDEWHQSFVPTRDGTLVDVGWDATGALLMGVFLWCVNWRGGDWVKRKVLGAEDVYNT